MAFIDFEKAFDRVNRCRLWDILKERGYPLHLVNVIKSLYNKTQIVINTGKDRLDEMIINQGVRQGCSLSPTLFNIYVDHIFRKWKCRVALGIKLTNDEYLNALLFADDLWIIQDSENDLQKSVYVLNEICKEYNFKISIDKTKIMAFTGKHPTRSKIVIDNKVLEQVSKYTYLGCDISYSEDLDIEKKIGKFQVVCGNISRTLGKQARRETIMKFYRIMAAPVLLYGSESWVTTKPLESRVQAAEMRFLRRTKGCDRRDHIRNDDIRAELGIYSLLEKVTQYRKQWKDHVERMPAERLPLQILNYKPAGKRSIGRPRKRWQ